MKDVYTLIKPNNPLPLIFDSPHSGRTYPDDFNYACDFKALQRAEDQFVDELFDHAPDHGAPFLKALFPRSYIDVNRCVKDIDHTLLSDIWPHDSAPSARSQAGIGLIRRLIQPNVPVYNRLLTSHEIKTRIDRYYRPYHAALENLITQAHSNYGFVYHINCHSMPSKPTQKKGLYRAFPARHADFVLGDRNGTSCDLSFTHAIRDFLKSLGYCVAINDPYKGVECVRAYSAPSLGRHSLQVEINKALYLDEKTGLKTKNFNILENDTHKLIELLTNYTNAQILPAAAD